MEILYSFWFFRILYQSVIFLDDWGFWCKESALFASPSSWPWYWERNTHVFTGLEGAQHPYMKIHVFIYLLFMHLQHMEVPGLGSNGSCMPQPQWIRAESETYTASCGNTGSLTTEWGQGSNPHLHGHFVRFLTHWATMGTPLHLFKSFIEV